MAAPRPKKKARPAKDLRPGDVRSQYTFKNESPQQSARDLKASDLRQKYAEGPKQSRPAADLKPGDSRASYLKKAKAKPYQPAPRAPKYAKPIGPQMPSSAGGTAKAAAGSFVRKTLGRAIGAIGAIVDPSFMNAKTGGAAEAPAPKKGERLMRGMPQVGYGSKTSSADYGYKPKRKGGGPERRQGSSSPSMGVKRSDSYFSDIPSYKGTQKAKTFKEKNLAANQKAGKEKKQTAKSSAAAPRKAREMTFQEAVRRNRTEEYERAKFRPKKSILSLFKKKGNK